MALGGADIAAILADLASLGDAVTVTIGAQSTNGLWDMAATDYFGGEQPAVSGTDRMVHIATGTLSGLSSGASITVAGTSYRVHSYSPYGDGAMTRIALVNA